MPRKKASPSAVESPEDKALNSAPEAVASAESSAPPAPTEPETPAAPEPVSEPAPEPPEDHAAPSPTPPRIPEMPPAPSDPPQAQEPPDSVDPIDGQSPSDPETPPVPDGRPALVVSSKGLNLREGPAFSFEVLSVLESGALVLILDLPGDVKVPGWELVNDGERTGWVSDRFLRSLME